MTTATAAQHKHPDHDHGGSATKKQSANAPHDKKMNMVMGGMSAAEKNYLRSHMAKMSTPQRAMILGHMTKMSAAERRKIVQQMMKGGGGGMQHGGGQHGGMQHGGMQHGHGDSGHHGGARGHHVAPGGGAKSSAAIQEPAALPIGARVPDFEVRDLQGKTHRLSDLRKQTKSGIVSLTFWCSFCHSCRSVETRLDRFASDHKDQAVVAAIDASAGETAAEVTAFASKRGLSLPILMDAPGKAADLFGVTVTTTTVVIDGQGILRYRGQFIAEDQMLAQNALKAVLEGKPVAVKETPQLG